MAADRLTASALRSDRSRTEQATRKAEPALPGSAEGEWIARHGGGSPVGIRPTERLIANRTSRKTVRSRMACRKPPRGNPGRLFCFRLSRLPGRAEPALPGSAEGEWIARHGGGSPVGIRPTERSIANRTTRKTVRSRMACQKPPRGNPGRLFCFRLSRLPGRAEPALPGSAESLPPQESGLPGMAADRLTASALRER
ncbi:hypothetical protein Metal_0881 [Methylomicrobium album BG8]|uniref:Uncharacterized protein n=1 Tax=Methylomicrobium album BG8 TaxID=686340 RepID=H8GFV4_METAL|nr:hypothetical protein Metal_0881 [Methylomicrobium album BG8]